MTLIPYHHKDRIAVVRHVGDMGLIADVVRARQPARVVELGTLYLGLAAFFADLVAPWGGVVHTFDHQVQFDSALLAEFPNVRFYQEDVLGQSPNARVVDLVREPGTIFYTDNGDKEKEIALYAPHVAVGNLLGTHDYWSEVRVDWVESHLAGLGYAPHRHTEFEALPCPPGLKTSLTRFWERVRT